MILNASYMVALERALTGCCVYPSILGALTCLRTLGPARLVIACGSQDLVASLAGLVVLVEGLVLGLASLGNRANLSFFCSPKSWPMSCFRNNLNGLSCAQSVKNLAGLSLMTASCLVHLLCFLRHASGGAHLAILRRLNSDGRASSLFLVFLVILGSNYFRPGALAQSR